MQASYLINGYKFRITSVPGEKVLLETYSPYEFDKTEERFDHLDLALLEMVSTFSIDNEEFTED